MDNGASSYRRFLDGDDKGLAEIVRDYKDGLILYKKDGKEFSLPSRLKTILVISSRMKPILKSMPIIQSFHLI